MGFVERWLWVTKDVICWEKLYDTQKDDEFELCANQPFKQGDKIIVYRSGNHRDLPYIFEVKKDSESTYGKFKTILSDKVKIIKPITLADLKKNPNIKKWKTKFSKDFHNIPFTQWNIIIELISNNNPDLFKKHKPKCCSGPDSNGFPVNYKEALDELLEKIRRLKNKDFFNEETTKQLIILPLLQKMGWNTFDICEVHPEHGVHHRSTRVDYILKDHESKQICLEAKSVSETDFDFHEKQLLRYCAFKHSDMGILTNGLIWRFYRIHYHSKDLGAIKKTDTAEIDLINDENQEIIDSFIKFLWKGKISENKRPNIKIPSIDEIMDVIKSMNPKDRNKFNEEAMKQGIIIPLLNNFGWNTYDPSQILFEKSLKIPYRKKHQKVDYILGDGSNKIVLEVKGLASDISDQNVIVNDEGHLLNYIKAGKYDFGILTNGIIWEFYLFKNGRYWGNYEINIKDENLNDDDFTYLLSKRNVSDGKHLKYLEKLV